MVSNLSKIIGDLLYNWQTTIGGGAALLGAVITVRVMTKQARDTAKRKSRAARAMLPAALAIVVLQLRLIFR